MTKIRLQLFEKLCEFYDDKDFVIGVMSSAVSDGDAQTLLDYMNNGDDVTAENIILLALELDISHEKAKAYDAKEERRG